MTSGNNAVVGVLRALLTLDQAEFERGIRKAQDHLKDFSRSTKQIGAQATQLGTQLTKTLTLPIIGFGGAVAKAAIDFESSFAGIRKTVNASEAEFRMLSAGMRDLAKTIPVNVNELNKIGEAAGQLGIKTENILSFTKVVAELGATTNLTTDQAASSLARLANITGMPQTEFRKLGSTIVELGNSFATTESELVDFGLRIAGAGALAKLSNPDILAIGTALSSVGVEAEAGGTAVQKVLLSMVKAVSQGTAQLDVFARTAGLTSDAFKKLFVSAPAEAFTRVVEGLGKAGNGAIGILSGLGLEDQRLMRSFLALGSAGDLLRRSITSGNTAWRENSALTKEAQTRFTTTASQLTALWNRLQDVGITIGNALLPTLKSMVGAMDALIPILERASKFFADLPAPIRNTAVALGLIAAAAGPLLFVIGQLAFAASSVAAAFGKAGLATKALSLLMSGTSGLTATVTAAGAAFKGSALLVAGFTAALAGIVVPLALMKVLEVIQQIQGLISDQQKWRADALAQTAVHTRAMAAASQIAGREVKTVAEAMEILRIEAGRLQAVSKGVISNDGLHVVLKGTAKVAKEAAVVLPTLVERLAAAKAEIAKLTEAQRANLKAGVDLGMKNDDLLASFNALFPAVHLSEQALDVFKDSLHGPKTAAQEFSESVTKLAADLTRGMARLTDEEFEKEFGDKLENMDRDLKKFGITGAKVPASIAAALLRLNHIDLREFTAMIRAQEADLMGLAVPHGTDRSLEGIDAANRAIEDATAASRDRILDAQLRGQQLSAQIDVRRAEAGIESAKRWGASWQQMYAMEAALAKRRLEVAIAASHQEFALRTATLDKTSAEYQALAQEQQTLIQSMVEDWQLGEIAKRDELRKTHDIWLKTWENLKRFSLDMTGAISDGFAELMVGLGRQTTETINGIEVTTGKFKNAMLDIWRSLQRGIAHILSDILKDFIGRFLQGLLGAIKGQAGAWQSAFGGLFRGLTGGAGGAGGAGGGVGVGATAGGALAGVAGVLGIGGGTAAAGQLSMDAAMASAAGTTTTVAPPAGAGLLSALAGPVAGAGVGLGVGLATGSKTWGTLAGAGTGAAIGAIFGGPIGAGIGALVGGVAGFFGGLFGGKRKNKDVEKFRHLFLRQFGMSTDDQENAQSLAKRLQQVLHSGAMIPTVLDLLSQKSLTGFRQDERAIANAFAFAGGPRVKQYNLGGFVPPNVTQPAILHGGAFGEVVAPLSKLMNIQQPHAVTLNFSIQTLDPREMSRIVREDVAPYLKRMLMLNQDGYLTAHKQVLQP